MPLKLVYQSEEVTCALIDFHLAEAPAAPLFQRIKKNASHRVLAYAYTADGTLEVHMRAVTAGSKRFFVKGEHPLDLIQTYMQMDYDEVKDYAFDDMTGLLNKRGFYQSALAKLTIARDRPEMHEPQQFALLYADGNGIKPINDQHGHDAGDRAIKHIADCLRQEIRPADLACRFHGDEYGVLLVDVGQSQATAKANEIQSSVAKSPVLLLNGTQVSVSLAVGVVDFDRTEIGPNVKESLEKFIHDADLLQQEDKGEKAR
jgi:diguanylate cyclase (GGDEF)-like protein